MPATKSPAKPKSRPPSKSSKSSPDYGIFGELKKEHKEMKGYFKKLEKGQDVSVFTQLSAELSSHQSAEEKALYAPLESAKEVREEILKGYEEHHAATMVLQELERGMSDEEHFKAKITVLMEMVEHHIEEEEKTLFARAKKLVDKNRAEQMLEEFEQLKE